MTATTGEDEDGTGPATRPASGEHPPTRRDRPYTLLGPDGRPYLSETPGTLAGHRRGRLYGRLDCPSARRAIAAGGYVRHRVFFADEPAAIAAGYRPCAVCLPAAYRRWKASSRFPASASEETVVTPSRTPFTATAAAGSGRGRSPLIRGAEATAYGPLPVPAPHTGAEVAALVGLLAAQRPRVRTVVLGHSRDAASRAAAEAFAGAFAEAWSERADPEHREAREGSGGDAVLAVVDWPERAASWLRAARRFTAPAPDAWVVAAAPLGWAQLARRLAQSTDWDPARTFGFASLAEPRAIALAGPDVLDGVRGAAAGGGTWAVRGGWLTTDPAGPLLRRRPKGPGSEEGVRYRP
ncbi:hypothetical protein [Kitasatospora sp. NPDC090091]|uniref:hypothetical protein n=1 Tax=Kitasatospora sp. NPDC090091 TaxID=3364081 RepID=UPI0037F34DA7